MAAIPTLAPTEGFPGNGGTPMVQDRKDRNRKSRQDPQVGSQQGYLTNTQSSGSLKPWLLFNNKFVQRNSVWLLHKCRVWPWTLSFPNRHSANHCTGCCHGYSWLGIHCDREGFLAAQALLLGESFFHVKTTPTHLMTSLQESPLSYEKSIQRYVLLGFCDCIAWWDPFDKTYFFIWGPALHYVFPLCIRSTVYFSLSFKLK